MTDKTIDTLNYLRATCPGDPAAQGLWEAAQAEKAETHASPSTCPHDTAYWYPATNEDGWQCADGCGQKLGFRPDLDRERTYRKVNDILHDLHDAGLVSISNGEHGARVAATVAMQCRAANRYDQVTIIRQIVNHPDVEDSESWAEQARDWLCAQAEREVGR